ncbi:unnamed protein product [Symbiodinium natans]|uniref:Uncharacterized protein n=1 Tax=Symbiodinium natans TaxID=878477 RepID=A0A812RL43_9DINO|nr:unnamed protein product [Symbiodinium natans]
MDSFSAGPIVYSSLEADELYESADDSDDKGEAAEDDVDVRHLASDSTLERIVRRRFGVWQSGEGRQCSIINEIFDRLHVHSYDVKYESSVRCLSLDFSIVGMRGIYEQRSCTDTSPTWELSAKSGQLEQVPNLKAAWLLDEETVLTCCHYEGKEAESWVDEKRLAERFGSETLERMGGMGVLLELIGLICADAGAPYATKLPFGLPEAIVRLGEAESSGRSGGYSTAMSTAPRDLPKMPTKPLPATSAGRVVSAKNAGLHFVRAHLWCCALRVCSCHPGLALIVRDAVKQHHGRNGRGLG